MKGLRPAFCVAPWPRTRGGPQVMVRRFIESVKKRRYTVLPERLTDRRQPCLLNIGHPWQDKLLSGDRYVAYRVAGLFIKESFERLGAIYGDRTFKPEFEKANENIRQALEKASFVIYQSRWSKTQLDSLYRRAEGSWRVIPNAVDLRTFKPPSNWPHKANDAPVLGMVGSLRYRPRLEVLFDVARRLPIRPRILLVGDMDVFCRKALNLAMEDPNWRPLIQYVPSVSPRQLVKYYQRIDCFIHTVSGDGCPNVVVEALACGIPIVCPEEGGTAELVGPAGVAVQEPEGIYGENLRAGMAEGIMRVLTDLPYYQKLARRQAEEKNDIEILTSLYLDALGFPPYPYQRGWKYAGVHLIGEISSRLTPKTTLKPGGKPRIGLILWDWNLGGTASWIFRIAEALTEFEFHFIATHLELHSPHCERLGSFAYAPNFWALRNYLKKQNIQLVQVSNNPWSVDAAKAAGVKKIVERTDGTRSCCSISKKELDFIIVSAAGTLPLIKRFWPDVPYEVIYNAVNLREIDQSGVQRIAPPGCVSIGRCSRFGKGKRLDLLIEAVARMKYRGLPVHLTLIGEDSRLPGAIPVDQQLRQQAESLENSVTFFGRSNDPISLTLGWDIGVCCSDLFNEGIPNSLIEPMACGKPVVSTKVDQVTELVEDGVNGFLVPPRDVCALTEALERLVLNPALRLRMGQAARLTIETKFSFDVAVSKYRRIYQELL